MFLLILFRNKPREARKTKPRCNASGFFVTRSINEKTETTASVFIVLCSKKISNGSTLAYTVLVREH